MLQLLFKAIIEFRQKSSQRAALAARILLKLLDVALSAQNLFLCAIANEFNQATTVADVPGSSLQQPHDEVSE